MNGRNTGSFQRLGPARAKAQKRRLFIIGGLAFVVTIAIISASVMLGADNSVARVGPEATPTINNDIAFGTIVLVAPELEVRKGTKLSRVALKKVYSAPNNVPAGAIRDVEKIKDMYAKVNLPAGFPLIEANLTSTPPSAGISRLLTPGHRAVTLDLKASDVVSGWASASAHVDVLLTYTDSQDAVKKTRVVVEDAVVLSYSGSTTKSETADRDLLHSGGKMATVTVMVSKDDALKLQTARAMGKVSLALRNEDDTSIGGDQMFGADSWRKAQHKPIAKQKQDLRKGFASYVDGSGKKQTMVLQSDDIWWKASNNGEDELE